MLSKFIVRGILFLMWAAMVFQGVIYVNAADRIQSLKLSIAYWREIVNLFFG